MSHDQRFPANISAARGGRRKVPTVLQMESTECGAACLAMVLAYHGRWVPLEELRVRCGVSRDGSKALNVLRAAREYGLEAQGFRNEVKSLAQLSMPMILFWQFKHFVVLEGVRKGKFLINDPAEGPQTISAEEFDRKYTGICIAFAPGPSFERGGSPPNLLRGLASRIGQANGPLLYILLVTLILVIPGLAIPTFAKMFVDDVLIPGSASLVMPLLIGLGLTAVVQSVLTWMQRMCIARLEIKLALAASSRFLWHVVTLPMTFFSQRFAGDVANRLALNDSVASLLSGELATSAINMLAMALYAAVMLAYDPLLSLVAFVMVVFNLIALRLVSRVRNNSNQLMLKEQGRVAGTAVNGIRMIETLKSNGAENEFFARLAGMHANALIAHKNLGGVTNLLAAVPPLLAALTTIAILGIGGLRILEGALTIGGLVAFQALARNFMAPINGLVLFGANLQTTKGQIARLDDVLNYPPDPRAVQGISGNSPEPPPPARGFISMKDVSFGYTVQEPPLIENFSLSIRPGQRVALVGGSGSGKSTVARLICGLLQPWSGGVRIDGRSIDQIPTNHFAAAVSYVDQEIILFEGSVRDNVTLWNPTIADRDVVAALRDAAVQDVVTALPGKYDAPVGEYGRNFSGGERQRLEIARALATNPAILVLDEATAALDPVTEMQIDSNLRRRGCTCVIVAHRLSTIRDADEIIVLDQGRIMERGSHAQLMAENGVYRALITGE